MSNGNTISANTISDNGHNGIYLYGGGNTVTGNTISGVSLFYSCIQDGGMDNTLLDNDCSYDWAATLADPLFGPSVFIIVIIVASIAGSTIFVIYVIKKRRAKKQAGGTMKKADSAKAEHPDDAE